MTCSCCKPWSTSRQVISLAILAGLLGGLTGWLHPQSPFGRQAGVIGEQVSLERVKQWPRVQWVDARTPEEYESMHIAEADNLTLDDWESQLPVVLDRWSPEVPVVVYCGQLRGRCGSAREVVHRLRQETGLTNVYELRGGWRALRRSPDIRWSSGQSEKPEGSMP